MEAFLNTFNNLSIAEIIVFMLVAYYLIKQPLDKRLDSQDKRFDDLRDFLNKRFDSQDKRFDSQDKKFDSQDKRLDDLKDLFESKIKPIEIALNNHITDTTKEIKALNDKLDKLIRRNN